MSYHLLGSMLGLMYMDAVLCFGFSGYTTWIWPLGLIVDESDGATLLLWLLLKNFLGDTSVLNGFVWSVARSAPNSLFLVPRFENWDSAQFLSLFFQRSFDWVFKWAMRYNFIKDHLFCHSLCSRSRIVWHFGTWCYYVFNFFREISLFFRTLFFRV